MPRKILVQLDTDPQPSAFDRVVAVDAGADDLFSYSAVKPDQVQALIHGCIFTRHPRDLSHTAVFVGGSNVQASERLFAEARRHLLPQFGLSVSLMLDPNGCNTTSAAAVRCAERHLQLRNIAAVVLGTGPVGQRVAQLLARQGAAVRIVSRRLDRAQSLCQQLQQIVPEAKLEPWQSSDENALSGALVDQQLLIAAGPPGVVMVSAALLSSASACRVLIDLNAVPPAGLEGVEAMDAGKNRYHGLAYGAIGVGNLKMKIHKAAIAALFTSNQLELDLETIYQLGASL